MAVFDKLNDLVKNFGDTSKQNSKISSEQNAINSDLKQIGEFYYKKYTETGKADKDIAELCAAIDGHNKAIADAKAEIERINAEKAAAASAPVVSGGAACPACGAANEAGRKFCNECGAKLVAAPAATAPATAAGGVVCPACGAENATGKKFCTECGGKLEAGGKSENNKRICACGAEVAPGVKFCTECGAKIN
jgi:DNA-directed RNA polymerase subunit RPC12/RpoP